MDGHILRSISLLEADQKSVLSWWHEQQLNSYIDEVERFTFDDDDDDDAAYIAGRTIGLFVHEARRHCDMLLALSQSLPETRDDRARRAAVETALKKLKPYLPTIGRGMSEANSEASNKRKPMVHEQGVYHFLCERPWHGNVDSFQQYTGFRRAEFDALFEELGGDRGHLFGEPRNHQGVYTAEENMLRRSIRGTMCDRDRVLCWLIMLRRNYNFHEMETMWGPSAATFERDFKWMTIMATTWPPLAAVSALFTVYVTFLRSEPHAHT